MLNRTGLAGNPPTNFFGRDTELAKLVEYAQAENDSNALAVLAEPGSGASELLRQVYDKLFLGRSEIVPVYFELKYSDLDARGCAIRFLRNFLLQMVAFRRRDLKRGDLKFPEIAALAMPEDVNLIDQLVETYESRGKSGDDHSFVRSCLSIPVRASANGTRCCVIVDAVHVADHLIDGEMLLETLKEIASLSSAPFILGGLRRQFFGQTQFETINIERLSVTDSGRVIESLAATTNTKINDQTRDLVAVQLGGKPARFAAFLAGEFGRDLTNFERVQRGYTNSVFGGHLGRQCDAVIDRAIPNKLDQSLAIKALSLLLDGETGEMSAAEWHGQTGLGDTKGRALRELHHHEIINYSSGSITIDRADTLVCDYIRSRSRIEVGFEQRARAVGDAMAENVKRAPTLMAKYYRDRAAIGLRELFLSFHGQKVPSSLIDYGAFKSEHKGAKDAAILDAARADKSVIAVPHIVFSAQTAAFYPHLSEICDNHRSAIGLGFTNSSDQPQTAWIAAEIDSKLEAPADLAEFWCDRLEMAAESGGLGQYRIWLIAPEGFNDDALSILASRNAYGSSRKQVDLLKIALATYESEPAIDGEVDEIVVPMGEEGEMISAKAVDEIAKRHGFSSKAANQIKTAVIEACINAAEHSLSPDQKIYQKYRMTAGKLTITITNRGLRLTDKKMPEPTPDGGRRGWGIKLMRSLMDEVLIAQTDDGTQITMVKTLSQ
ncbi:MAG: ATP-binding protein [Pyrinomonadaceae bacterium]